MRNISQSVTRKDHLSKITGKALYVDDDQAQGVLVGRLLHSDRAKAKILDIKLPALPPDCYVIGWQDVPGENCVAIVKDDYPVFAKDQVEFIGETILMVAAPDRQIADRILEQIEVVYEDLPPVLDVRKADTVFFDYHYEKGNAKQAFADADQVISETFETGYQEQAYLEPQGMIAYVHDGKVTVHGSMQCPYYVHGAVCRAMGYAPDQVQIKQDVTGGGFGGKEDYPSILGCEVAVAAHKTGRPVKVILDRREDMASTSKRHPSVCAYKAAIKNGKVTALEIEVLFNAGAYTTLSAVVLQRGVLCAPGVYNIDHLKVSGKAVKTNTVPNGAYRGFGAPQTFFAVEMLMEHIAKKLGEDSLCFKARHLVKKGDQTSTNGRYHFPVPLPAMIDEIDAIANYREKRKAYDQPQTGRFRKGIGISLVYHGAGFTGTGERDTIKATAKLQKNEDDSVEILVSNSDIGQGLKTTFSKIVAKELNIPYDKIVIENPDTDRVPDSGPTVASRSLMIVGELLRRAAIKLRGAWETGKQQIVEEHYKEPDFMIPFSLETFQGDAYPTYAWSVNVLETQVDLLTGQIKVLGAYGNYDVGTPIDYNIVVGQMEGGLLQGIGYSSMEKMTADAAGRIRQASYSDYLIPTAKDVPNMQVILHVEEYPDGPYGAKGAGELPLVGVAPAFVSAVEQAIGRPLYHAPVSAEDILNAVQEGLE